MIILMEELRPEIVEKIRNRFYGQIIKFIYIFTILICVVNIIIFVCAVSLSSDSLNDYLFNGATGFITLVILCNTYFMISDIFIYKIILNGVKLVDYKKNSHHIVVMVQLIFRIMLYVIIAPKLSICQNSCISGTVWQLGFNILQFVFAILTIYVPLSLVFLNIEPTKCYGCEFHESKTNVNVDGQV